MARGVNKVMLIGNVGGDPEVRYLSNGSAVTTITLATSETWKDKQTGQSQERTEWHRVVFFNRLGEIAGEYLRKGSKIYVQGSLRTNKWQDQEGKDRYRTEIIGNEMQMLDGRNSQNNNQQAQNNASQGSSQQQMQQGAQQSQQGNRQNKNQQGQQKQSPYKDIPHSSQHGQQQSAPNTDDFDDDIPFENPYKNSEYCV